MKNPASMRRIALFSVVGGAACMTDAPNTSATTGAAIGTCHNTTTQGYTLGSVSTDGTTLLVDALTAGCATQSFAMCWDGSVLDSNPPQVNLELSFMEHGYHCDIVVTHDLRFDLAPIRRAASVPLTIHVLGAAGQEAGTTNTVLLPQ